MMFGLLTARGKIVVKQDFYNRMMHIALYKSNYITNGTSGLQTTPDTPYCWHGLISIPTRISNYIHDKVLGKITYRIQDFTTVQYFKFTDG